jgi:hypothetical protein
MTMQPIDQLDEFDPAAERRAYVERVVRHRCGDVVGEAELAHVLSQPESATVPKEVAERIETVLELIVARLDAIEDRLDGRRVH